MLECDSRGFSLNSPKPSVFGDTDGISKHRLTSITPRVRTHAELPIPNPNLSENFYSVGSCLWLWMFCSLYAMRTEPPVKNTQFKDITVNEFKGSIKNIHLSYFRNLKFVFSVLICRYSSLPYPSIRVRTAPPVSVRVRVRVSVSFSVTVLCLQLWRCIFLMCPEFNICEFILLQRCCDINRTSVPLIECLKNSRIINTYVAALLLFWFC